MSFVDQNTILDQAVEAIEALRRDGARVHCITNTVAQYFTANVLLACGATPSMTVSQDESHLFTGQADALLVNLGTLDAERRRVIGQCIETASHAAKPVVLDPVKCDLSPPRLKFARELLAPGRIVLKANRQEAQALDGAPALARITTGRTDKVAYDGAVYSVQNGTAAMADTIATGCALGAVVAALIAAADEPHIGALAALAWFGVAGELASEKASGPGTFPAVLVDALALVSSDTIRRRARLR